MRLSRDILIGQVMILADGHFTLGYTITYKQIGPLENSGNFSILNTMEI